MRCLDFPHVSASLHIHIGASLKNILKIIDLKFDFLILLLYLYIVLN